VGVNVETIGSSVGVGKDCEGLWTLVLIFKIIGSDTGASVGDVKGLCTFELILINTFDTGGTPG